MIERTVIDGRPATVAYFDEGFIPIKDLSKPHLAKVLFDDGEMIILRSAGVEKFNPYHEPAGSPIGGQFAERPGGAGTKRPQVIGKAGEFKSKIEEAVAGIPAEHAAAVSNVPIRIVNEIRWGQPGWDETSTKGLFTFGQHPDGVGIRIAEKQLLSHSPRRMLTIKDPGGVVVHELGHAIDHRSNWGHSKSLKSIFFRDIVKLNYAERVEAAYYVDDPEEMFAEVYSMAYGPKHTPIFFGGVVPRERALSIFADSIKAVKEITVL